MESENQPCLTKQQLSDYSLGKLDSTSQSQLDEHLQRCEICVAQLSSSEDSDDVVIDSLRSLPDQDTSAAVLRDLVDTVKANVKLSETVRDPVGVSQIPSPTLGRYTLQQSIGQGGMGAVFRAIHTGLDKVVAIKILPAERTQDADVVGRFQREMKLLGRMEHPNVVRAMDAGAEDGVHFLAMELVDGLDMSSVVRRIGPLPIADACEVIRQAAVGLQHAHEHGLVHRDMKPSNVMLTQSGVVKVMDLGLARLSESDAQVAGNTDELTVSGQIMGTVDYMAPEQVNNSHAVDVRADIFSLGATLYRLLADRMPYQEFDDQSMLSKLNAVAGGQILPIGEVCDHIPAELSRVVDRMLERDVDSRFQTPAEFAEAIQPFCQGSDLPALIRKAVSLPSDDGAGALQATIGGHPLSDTQCEQLPQVAAQGNSFDRRHKKWLIATAVVLMACAGFWFYFKIKAGNTEVVFKAGDSGTDSLGDSAADRNSSPVAVAASKELGANETVMVSPMGGRGTLTLQQALATAQPGQTILLAPGEYPAGPDRTAGDFSCYNINVDGLTIRGSYGSFVNSILVQLAPALVVEDLASHGVSSSERSSQLTIRNCRVLAVTLGTESTYRFENSVFAIGGGYKCWISFDHCAVSTDWSERWHSVSPSNEYRATDSVFFGSRYALALSTVDTTNTHFPPMKYENCLLFSPSGSIATAESNDPNEKPDLIPLDQLGQHKWIQLTDCMIENDEKTIEGYSGFLRTNYLDRDLRLPEQSKAKGAASDGSDIGPIADASGWPLVPTRDAEAATNKESDSSQPDPNGNIVNVTLDGSGNTLTLIEALEQAQPGQILELAPGIHTVATEKFPNNTNPMYRVTTPDLTIRGDHSVIPGGIYQEADRLVLENLYFWLHTLPEDKAFNVTVRNCRCGNVNAGHQVRRDRRVEISNSVCSINGGLGADVSVSNSILYGYQHAENYYATEFHGMSRHKIKDSILAGPQYAFTLSDSNVPPLVVLENCLVFSPPSEFAVHESKTWTLGDRIPLSRLASTPGFELLNCAIGQDPKFADVTGEVAGTHKLNLLTGSPAIGSASDGGNLGPRADELGWPLIVRHHSRYTTDEEKKIP